MSNFRELFEELFKISVSKVASDVEEEWERWLRELEMSNVDT